MPTTLTCFLKQTQLQFAVFGFKLTSDFRYIVSVSNKFITWDVSTSDLARQVHPGKAPVQCLNQRTLTYFVRGNITVWLTSCLTGLASTKLVNLNRIQHKQNSKILPSQTGGQPYSDTSPCKVIEFSLSKSVELFSRRSWRLVYAQSSNQFGYYPSRTVSAVLIFYKHNNSLTLELICYHSKAPSKIYIFQAVR